MEHPHAEGQEHRAPQSEPPALETLSTEELREVVFGGGQVNEVAPIPIASDIAGIESISIIPFRTPEGAVTQLSIVPYAEGDGMRHTTLTMRPDGVLMGRLPSSIRSRGITEAMLEREVLLKLEPFTRRKFFEDLAVHIAPPLISPADIPLTHYEGSVLPPGSREEGAQQPPRVHDDGGTSEPVIQYDDRIQPLLEHPAALFGFVNKHQGGFNQYYGFVFEAFVILEHPKVNNAVFIVDIPRIDPTTVPPHGKEREAWLLAQPWVSLLTQTKAETKTMGAWFTVHAGEWRERILEEIDRRLQALP
ncbi:hypothetical protein HY480_02660 [Candidatus Uhrbacteria bacterium]|nr:hypothetical protein [Candidatus Uhrbacteria bacterium]